MSFPISPRAHWAPENGRNEINESVTEHNAILCLHNMEPWSVFEISVSTDIWLTNSPPAEGTLSRHIRLLICLAMQGSFDIEHLTKLTC